MSGASWGSDEETQETRMPLSTSEILSIALSLSGFDKPPADTAVYVPSTSATRVLFGIDMETPELLLAKELGFDLVISHHPGGDQAVLDFPDVMTRLVEFMKEHGVPDEKARKAVDSKIFNTRCMVHQSNFDRATSAARLLGMPYMNIHLPLDEIGRKRMVDAASGLGPGQTVADLVQRFLEKLPEFREAPTEIDIRVGAPSAPLGSIAIIHAGGTNGGYPVASTLYDHGVDTVVYIHCSGADSEKLRDEYQDKGRNLVITGHMVSDSLGINPFVDELERRGMEVRCMSGIIRATKGTA
jgi:hypothetical protein